MYQQQMAPTKNNNMVNRTYEHTEYNYVLHIWHKETQPDWGVIMEEVNSFFGSSYFYPAGKIGGEDYHVVLLTDEAMSAESIMGVVQDYKSNPGNWFPKAEA